MTRPGKKSPTIRICPHCRARATATPGACIHSQTTMLSQVSVTTTAWPMWATRGRRRTIPCCRHSGQGTTPGVYSAASRLSQPLQPHGNHQLWSACRGWCNSWSPFQAVICSHLSNLLAGFPVSIWYSLVIPPWKCSMSVSRFLLSRFDSQYLSIASKLVWLNGASFSSIRLEKLTDARSWITNTIKTIIIIDSHNSSYTFLVLITF